MLGGSLLTPRRTARTGVERALGKARRDRKDGGEQCLDRQLLGDDEVPGQQRKGAPGESEPEVGVEEAAEELEVVREDEKCACGDEREEPERPRQCRADADGDGAADRAEREPQSTRVGIRVASGRPWSSSSACAPIPSARKNAASAASRRFVSSSGASAAPIAT